MKKQICIIKKDVENLENLEKEDYIELESINMYIFFNMIYFNF